MLKNKLITWASLSLCIVELGAGGLTQRKLRNYSKFAAKVDPVANNNSKSASGPAHLPPLIKASQVNIPSDSASPLPPGSNFAPESCSVNELKRLSASSREPPTASSSDVCVNSEVLILTGREPIFSADNRRELAELACLLNQNWGMKINRELSELFWPRSGCLTVN